MFKLIMADIKVLGNKIWLIPLGLLVFTIIAALILGSKFDDSFMFIEVAIIPIIVVLLGYSLMHYSENSKLHNEIGSLPCSSLTIVLEKYLMVLLFISIGFIVKVIYIISISILSEYAFNYGDVFAAMNFTIIVILIMSLFAIPLFFKSRSAATAYFGTFVWFAGLGTIFGTVLVKLYPFADGLTTNVIILVTMSILSVIAMGILYIKDDKSNRSWKKLLIIPVASILPATLFSTIGTIINMGNLTLLYNLMLPGYKRMFLGDEFPDYLADAYRVGQIGDQFSYLLLNGLTSIVLIGVVIYVWKRGKIQGLIKNAGLILILPLVLLSVGVSFFIMLYVAEIIMSNNNVRISLDSAYLITFYGSIIPLFLISVHYSKKFLTGGDYMFKLIIADMKVLGHRLWIIPVGVFLFVMMFSFIPYLNQVQQFQYLIFISLIPALLLYELFRENNKNNSEIMVMAMPIDRKKFVYSKYLLLFGFIVIGFVVGLISKELIIFFNIGLNNNFIDPMSKDMLVALTFILRVGLFIIPIYHYTRKLNLSFFAGIIGYFLILAGYFEVYYKVFHWTWFSDHVMSHLSNVSIVILIALIIHLVIKYKFKRISKEKIVNGWFIVLVYLTTVTFQLLIKNLNHFNLYLRLKKICNDLTHLYTAEKLEQYRNYISEYNEYLLMVGVSFIVLTIALILIHRKAENKFFQYAVLFVMLPIFMIIFDEYSYDFFTWNFRRFHSSEAYVIAKILFSYLNLIIGVFISLKVSIYLLKNNRTL